MKRVAVILSGCGVYDGSEIHESVLTLLALSKHNVAYQCFAPDIEQMHVINHATGEVMSNEKRNVFVESARIARGNIKKLSEFNPDDFDAIIFPGGYGAAKNLSDFAVKGDGFSVNPSVAEIIKIMHQKKKPIGALCISPVLIAKVISGAVVTIGKDKATADIISQIGSQHKESEVDDVAVDYANKIVTTPCYMLDAPLYKIFEGINKLVEKIVELS